MTESQETIDRARKEADRIIAEAKEESDKVVKPLSTLVVRQSKRDRLS